ncbi:MAG: serine hydroxymethyltransferase [Sedimentisphaerales bacterium]|nr:serine hydroxymethyltransferase [Sedimentisphaerales bacterium]
MLLDRYKNQTRQKSSKKIYELIDRQYGIPKYFGTGADGYHSKLFENLNIEDRHIAELIKKEYERFSNCLQLTAAQNICSKAVLGALGSVLQNKTAEGSIENRLHGGCSVVNELEALAAERAKQAFGAQYANVQPHSGSIANLIVFKAILQPGDRILSLDFTQGGHTSHGGSDSLAESVYEVHHYVVEPTTYLFDYDKIYEKAKEVKPKLIICGASVYPRKIDFAKFRTIVDRVGAFLLADISHIAGLVIAGVHSSPIDFAHITTTSTYKSGGPRGGLILSGKEYQIPVETCSGKLPLFEAVERAVFPGVQGTPYFNNIAAKAVFFKEAVSEKYNLLQFKIVENAKKLSKELIEQGFDVLTGGTDNHMLLLKINNFRDNLNGIIARKALENCGIIIDSFSLPYQYQQNTAMGLRLGTQIVSKRGMGFEQMEIGAELIAKVLRQLRITGAEKFEHDQTAAEKIRQTVKDLCSRFALC